MSKAQGSLCNGGKYDNHDIVKKTVSLKHDKSSKLPPPLAIITRSTLSYKSKSFKLPDDELVQN